MLRSLVLTAGLGWMAAGVVVPVAVAQAAPAAPAPQLGTVTAISGTTVTLKTDAGVTETVAVPDGTKVSQSADLKTMTPSDFSQIAVGDRVLAAVKAGDTPASFTARQVVIMKSADHAKVQADEQADWRVHGTGGIVSSVDPAAGTITIAIGPKKLVVNTTAKTDFKRFAGDSVNYSDAKPGTLAQIHVGDQLQARGDKSADGNSLSAAEVVSGSFKNLSGQLQSVDAAAGKITLKDLATKKEVTVIMTPKTDIRRMPVQQATAFAARVNGGAAGGGGGRRGGGGGGGNAAAAGGNAGGPGGNAGGPGGGGRGGATGTDLAQMVPRMPQIQAADLVKGDAVMIVAGETTEGGDYPAISVLAGVDPILTASPNGGMDLSMSMGGGGGGAE